MKTTSMVINRKTDNNSYTESYDDLDAINDFVLEYEKKNNIHSSPEEMSNQNNSKLSTNINMEVSESKGPYMRASTQNNEPINRNIESDSSIITIKFEIDSESSNKLRNIELVKERGPINITASTEKCCSLENKSNLDVLSNSNKNNEEGVPENFDLNTTDTKLACTNLIIRRNSTGSKFIITKADKVIECDISKMNHKKSKKPRTKTTVYNIGRVSTESLLKNSMKTTYDVKNIFGDKTSIPMCSDLKQENPITEVLEVVKTERSDEDDIQHRYFVGKIPSPIHISEAREYSDLKYKELYDSVQKRSKTGIMTTNYVKLIQNKLVCFRSKHIKHNDLESGMLYFEDPYNVNFCYPEKYVVDLSDSRLYIVTGSKFSLLKIMFCCRHKICRSDMHDITDLEIHQIDPKNDKFLVSFNREGLSEFVEIKNLDFVIFKDNEYYWFRCNNTNTFMKWIACIQIRRVWNNS